MPNRTPQGPGGPVSPAVLVVCVLLLLAPAWAAAQDESAGNETEAQPAREVDWRNTTELSYLVSGGNSATSTLGLRHSLRRNAPRGDLRVDLALLRTDATRFQRYAVGVPESFRLEEDRDTERTAERYAVQGRYDLNVGERAFTTASAGWQRNTFAGFRGRTILSLGGGSRWRVPDEWELKLSAGLTYTFQDDVDPDPERERRFGGVRVTVDHEHQLTSGTSMEVKWVVDANAEDRQDVRGDLAQSVSADLTDRLALKTTLQFLVDNDPPMTSVPLQTPDGTPTGESVRVPLRKADRLLSVALVVTF
jgi:putative salt-induced outer membrane protein YdiY